MTLEHWETYYRTGALASCPLGPGADYTLELRDIWVEFFATLDNGSRILDIGTGNGAIALIAQETAAQKGRRFEIHGSDLARIDPKRDVRDGVRIFADIQFHGGVPNDQLPFPAASFDAVSGQYALEYADIRAALGEVFRVLKSGGRAQFVIHHEDSVVLRHGRAALAHAELVLNRTSVFRKLRRYLEAEHQSRAAARTAQEELVAAVRLLQNEAQSDRAALIPRVAIDAVQKLLNARQQITHAEMDRHIGRVEGDIRASVRRLRDLAACAQSAQGVAFIRSTAESVGFTDCAAREQLHGGANLVGWRLNLGKP